VVHLAFLALDFESVWFMRVSGTSVVARPIRRPGRSNVASVIDGDADDRVGVDSRSRKAEGVLAVRQTDESSRSRRNKWREGKFREIADQGDRVTSGPRADPTGMTPSSRAPPYPSSTSSRSSASLPARTSAAATIA
jgi:hypothetical protein